MSLQRPANSGVRVALVAQPSDPQKGGQRQRKQHRGATAQAEHLEEGPQPFQELPGNNKGQWVLSGSGLGDPSE